MAPPVRPEPDGYVCPHCGQPMVGLTGREAALLSQLTNQIKLTSMLSDVHADVIKHVTEHIALLTRQRDQAWQARDEAREEADRADESVAAVTKLLSSDISALTARAETAESEIARLREAAK